MITFIPSTLKVYILQFVMFTLLVIIVDVIVFNNFFIIQMQRCPVMNDTYQEKTEYALNER